MDEPTSPVLAPTVPRTTTDRLDNTQFVMERPQRAERRLLIILLPLFVLASVTGWLDSELAGVGRWYERYVLLPAGGIFAAMLVWAIRLSPARVWQVRTATLVLGPLVILIGFGQQLWELSNGGFDDTHYFGMSVWLVFSSALYIFLLPARYSWRYSVGYYLITVVMLVVFLVFNTNPIPRFVFSEIVMNNLVAPPVFIVLLSAFTRLRVEYSRARTHAEDLRELALVDGLTQLPNRRAFGLSFKRAKARMQRSKTPLCAMVLDIDHFKRINDTFGHQTGDKVLARLGAVLTKQLRGTDEVFRWGGEEFSVLLEETPGANLPLVAERLRQAIHDARLLDDGRVTVSIGATHVLPADTEESVFRRADAALYQSKKDGRNRVTVHEGATARTA